MTGCVSELLAAQRTKFRIHSDTAGGGTRVSLGYGTLAVARLRSLWPRGTGDWPLAPVRWRVCAHVCRVLVVWYPPLDCNSKV